VNRSHRLLDRSLPERDQDDKSQYRDEKQADLITDLVVLLMMAALMMLSRFH
jgi:hypothetical protein